MREPTRVLVCGSRGWIDVGTVTARLSELPEDATIIHGMASGADAIAADFAELTGRTVIPFRAEWEKHGKRARIIRNIAMLDEQPDLVIAFWNGESRGTKHTIDEATRRGIPVEIVRGGGSR